MRIREVFTLFALSVIVKGSLWAAAVQPIILSLGAMMAAVDQDVLNVHFFDWKSWFRPVVDEKRKEAKRAEKSVIEKEKSSQEN